MANGPLIAPLPWAELEPGQRIVLEAIDPSTGATVSGVVISDATIYARETDDDGGELAPLEPVYLLAGGS